MTAPLLKRNVSPSNQNRPNAPPGKRRRNAIKPNSAESDLLREFSMTYQLQQVGITGDRNEEENENERRGNTSDSSESEDSDEDIDEERESERESERERERERERDGNEEPNQREEVEEERTNDTAHPNDHAINIQQMFPTIAEDLSHEQNISNAAE